MLADEEEGIWRENVNKNQRTMHMRVRGRHIPNVRNWVSTGDRYR